MSVASIPVTHKILVVDDDPRVLPLVEKMLVHGGFQPQVFASAIELLSNVREDDIGCVITDLEMPEMGGIELQERLLAIGSCLSIVVISG